MAEIKDKAIRIAINVVGAVFVGAAVIAVWELT